MKHIGLAEARDNLSNLVNDVAHGGQRIMIESRGRPKAVMVGLEDFARLQRVDADRGSDPMQQWLHDAEQLLRGQPRLRGSSLDALREVREGVIRDSAGVYRRQRRPEAPRRRKR